MIFMLDDKNISKISKEQALDEDDQDSGIYHPHWIVKKGNMIILIFSLVLFLLSWLIRYPDTIKGSARLIMPYQSGKIYMELKAVSADHYKIVKEQNVNIRISGNGQNYPACFTGTIEQIQRPSVQKDSFLVRIRLSDGLGDDHPIFLLLNDSQLLSVLIRTEETKLFERLRKLLY
jgi:hypothetical protein